MCTTLYGIITGLLPSSCERGITTIVSALMTKGFAMLKLHPFDFFNWCY